MSSQVTLNGATILVTNSVDSSQKVSAAFGNPTLTGTTAMYDFALSVGTTSLSVTIPGASVASVLWVRNTDAANKVTLTFTPVGFSQTSILIPSGGMFMYFAGLSGGANGGLTLPFSVLANATTLVEMLVAY